MKDTTVKAKAKINAWAKEAIELQEEFETAMNMAQNHQTRYDSVGDDSERKSAMRYLGKAWKAAKRIAAIKESIHWEANALEKFYQSILETAPPDSSDEANMLKADADYFKGVSKKATVERDEFLEVRRKTIARIRQLRLTTHDIATA